MSIGTAYKTGSQTNKQDKWVYIQAPYVHEYKSAWQPTQRYYGGCILALKSEIRRFYKTISQSFFHLTSCHLFYLTFANFTLIDYRLTLAIVNLSYKVWICS